MKKWGESISQSDRLKLKGLICVLGIVLLFVLLIVRALQVFMGLEEKEPKPILRNLVNVWIMEVNEDSIQVFEEGTVKRYPFADGVQIMSQAREQVANIRLSDEKVTDVICKREKINGKVLSVDKDGVTLEGYGKLLFSPSVRGYRLYGTLSVFDAADIMIGYDFADFVIENGEICGILGVKEEKMEYIRVLIKTSDYKELLHQELTFTCDTDFTIKYGPYEQPFGEYHQAGELCTIDVTSSLWQSDRIVIEPAVLTGKTSLKNVRRSQQNGGYRGTLELVKTVGGIAVINEVLLEEYLYSVVPSEMPASYLGEALKAQAVCARTYAYKRMLHAGYPRYGAHVDDSTSYQVYHNIAEQEETTTAVKETYGQVLLTQDGITPADTYYYSTSCGVGTNGDVWSIDESISPDYLVSDHINKNAFRNSGYEGTKLALTEEEAFSEFIRTTNGEDFEVTESWYRWQYTVSEFSAEVLREKMAARYEVSPAQILTLQKDGTYKSQEIGKWKTVKDISVEKRGPGGVAHELLIVTEQDTYKVITEYSIRYVLCDGTTQVLRQDGKYVNMATILPSGYFVIDLVKEDNEVTGYVLTGGGYGHGVGMSQNGARHMADSGLSVADILRFFYKNCTIENIYE